MDDIVVNTKDTYLLQGIHENMVSTIESVLLDIDIGKSKQQIQFQLVLSTFPIPKDGIIGRTLLEKLKAVIKQGTLTSNI